MQYKSIAGPIGLTVEGGGGYEDAVRQYAHIIDKEAVGGWKFCWMQQIPVIKKSPSIGGILGLAFFAGVIGFFLGDGIGVAIVAAIAGGVLGFFVAKEEKAEIFNMLIFSNDDETNVSPKPTLSSNTKKNADGSWRCSACDDKNPPASRFCKGCGKQM